MPTHDAIRKALEQVLRPYDVLEAYAYGSYARGEQTPKKAILTCAFYAVIALPMEICII